MDLLWGIGGTPEGVISAAAVKCIGGQLLGRLWPRDDDERAAAVDAGYDLDRVLDRDDLVAGEDCFFSATGVTDGDVLAGRPLPRARGGATTESLVMRSRSGTIRRIRATHDRAKLRELHRRAQPAADAVGLQRRPAASRDRLRSRSVLGLHEHVALSTPSTITLPSRTTRWRRVEPVVPRRFGTVTSRSIVVIEAGVSRGSAPARPPRPCRCTRSIIAS